MKKYKINVMKWNLEKYNSTPLFYQKFQVLLLMENANTHLVSVFKDYLLYDDMTEFFKEYYNSKEIYPRLKTIFDYYESSSYLFPNYTAINEGKYIYRNIIKKQKLIDYLEELEDKKKEKEEKQKLKNKKKYENKNEQSSSSIIEVFNTKIYDNIRKETWNDSKINELFCVDNKNDNESDSFASLVKLTEMIKDKDKEKERERKYIKCIIIDKGISNNNNKDNKNKEYINNSNNNSINDNNKYNNNKENINKINKDSNLISKDNNYIKNNQNITDNKIYVSRRISIHQISNKKIYIKKPEVNININNYVNNNYNNNSNTNSNIITNANTNNNSNINKNINYNNANQNINNNINITNNNLSNRSKNINTEPSKSNDFAKNGQNKIYQKNPTNSTSNKNTYKKNNIIINIINNNKNNNFNTNNDYFQNNNTNENFIKNNNYNYTNYSNFQINNNYYPSSYINTNENQNINVNNKSINNLENIKLNNIKNNNSVKNNHHNIKININTNNFSKSNNIDKIKGQISSKGLTVRNTINNDNGDSKKIIKRAKNEIKSKILSFRLATDILSVDSNLIRNLTERIRKQTQSNSIKKGKDQKKMKNAFSPRKNIKKRTKTEITGAKSDIFLFRQQNEINPYNKSINRQILKNINLTNGNKQKKDIALVNKKIVNSHFNLNTNSKPKIKTKYIKHTSTNSQNLTSIGIINKINPLPIKDLVRKKATVFSFNKTERTSRNHSKDKINKTIIKRNIKESFSPKKSHELIYNKIHRIQNRNNNIIICSFLKGVNSNQKIKNLKIKRKNNNSNFQSVNINPNNKEFLIKLNMDKNQ